MSVDTKLMEDKLARFIGKKSRQTGTLIRLERIWQTQYGNYSARICNDHRSWGIRYTKDGYWKTWG